MVKRKSHEEALESGMTLVQMYRRDPILAAKDLLNVELAVPQRAVLRDMWFKNFVALSAARGFGKTYICAVLASLQAMLYPGQKVGLLGPSFRQAKMLFAEVEKIWTISPLFQEATIGKPTVASDRCYLKFHQAGNLPASIIEAIPLGDGGKIRGARYYVIVADEFAQIPEEIFNTVILPMGATTANPMENVKRIARHRELLAKGIDLEEDDGSFTNKIIMTSSAYYQFNHMYRTINDYQEKVLSGDKKYSVHTVAYNDLPEGFLSPENLINAKSRLSDLEFRMEYLGEWVSDSAGIFKASLIEKHRREAGHTVLLRGEPGREYVLGCDPARTSDAFALCLIELGAPSKVVGAWEYYAQDFPRMSQIVMELCQNFNITAIHMDAGGGGLAIKDLLAEDARYGANRILDVDDELHQNLDGRHILHMANFSPKWIAEANYNSLNLIEKGGLQFPKPPQIISPGQDLEKKEDVYDTVSKMLKQMMLIEVTENRSGTPHFDVPKGGGHGSQKKDLYTAFVLAAKQTYDMTLVDEEGEGILHIGIAQDRNPYVGPYSNNVSGLDVFNTPVTSWGFRKTFKPGG